MHKPTISLLFYALTLSFLLCACCCKYDDVDFKFSKKYTNYLKPYKQGDTIYFADQYGDYDTVLISAIDTLQECGCVQVSNRKTVRVRIRHLPQNRWNGGTESKQSKPATVLDQELIVVEKTPDKTDPHYFTGINFRNFSGEISDSSNRVTDDRFKKYHVRNYLVIRNNARNWKQYRNDSTMILNLFWTEKYGLTGYELRNGQQYTIRI